MDHESLHRSDEMAPPYTAEKNSCIGYNRMINDPNVWKYTPRDHPLRKLKIGMVTDNTNPELFTVLETARAKQFQDLVFDMRSPPNDPWKVTGADIVPGLPVACRYTKDEYYRAIISSVATVDDVATVQVHYPDWGRCCGECVVDTRDIYYLHQDFLYPHALCTNLCLNGISPINGVIEKYICNDSLLPLSMQLWCPISCNFFKNMLPFRQMAATYHSIRNTSIVCVQIEENRTVVEMNINGVDVASELVTQGYAYFDNSKDRWSTVTFF